MDKHQLFYCRHDYGHYLFCCRHEDYGLWYLAATMVFFSLSSLSQSSNHTAETNRNKGSNFLVDLDIPLELKTETKIEYLWWYKCWKFMSFLLLKKLFTQLFMSTGFFDPLQYKGNNGMLLRQCLQSIFRNNAEKSPLPR